MTISLKHQVTAVGTDAGNGEIGKTQWNQEHVLTASNDTLIGRATAGPGAVEEITCTAAGRALLDDANASAQRTTLGLGDMATQDANAVDITGGSVVGITDLAVADGGTGASDAAGARSNLGLGSLATLSTVGTSQIDNSAVTYAKIQNVTATDKLLGRSSSGAGVVEEITCTAAGRALLDDANATAQIATLGLSASSGSNSIGFLQAGTGAVARTMQSKARDVVSVFDFMTSAQIASVQARDALVDVSAAIQAAIDYLKPSDGAYPEKGGVVNFPPGTYMINNTINTYSAITLNGSGVGTVIYAGPSLTNAVFFLSAASNSTYIFGGIQNLKIQTVPDIFTPVNTTIWAIKSDQILILQSVFQNISLWVRYGIKLDGYTQDCLVSEIHSVAQVDQILNLKGNWNRIESITKEGGGGEGLAGTGIATSEPYVYIGGAALYSANGNMLKSILIEGAGSPSKCAIKFENASAELTDFWCELNSTAGYAPTNGYAMEIYNSAVTNYGVLTNGPITYFKYKLRTSSQFNVDQFGHSYSQADNYQDYFDFDTSSLVLINNVSQPLDINIYRIDKSQNLNIDNFLAQSLLNNPVAGRSPRSYPHYRSGQNLLINPSFEAGLYGWTINSSNAITLTFPQSQVGQGLMLQCVHIGMSVEQTFVVAAAQIGNPITFTYVVKLDGAGWVVPFLAGYGSSVENRVYAGTGWQTVTVTYRPQSAGTYAVGVSAQGGGSTSCTLYLDEMSVCFGDDGIINTAKFGSFELNGNTVTYAAAQPASGTWKVGDRVFNSVPAIGSPKGWVCTVAGSPGTWVSEGNL